MGCPLGRSGWVILRGMLGWVRDREWADSIRLVLIFCHYTCGLSWFIARYVCEVVTHPLLSIPFFVPFLGKHVAQVGQARYPTRASTLPHLGTFPSPPVPNIPLFHHTNIFLFLSLSPATQSPQSAISSHYLSPHVPHPLPSSPAVIKLYEILQTASGQLPDTFPSNTPGFASRQCVDNPKSVIRACLYFGILEEWILFVF